jgi:hypothetical protein
MEIYARIEEGISYLPPPIRASRMQYLVNIIHGVLATVERQLGAGELAHGDVPLIVADLTDMVTAAITAPLGIETIAALREA